MHLLEVIYHFLVGDIIILVGILLTLALLMLLNEVGPLEAWKGYSGVVMIGGTLLVLGLTLGREARPTKKQES